MSEWLSSKELAAALGTYDRWVFRKVKELGIASEEKALKGITLPRYPPGTLDALRAEQVRLQEWHEFNQKNKQRMTAGELAEEVGRSRQWVIKTLAARGISPTSTQPRRGFSAHLFPPGTLKIIVEENKKVPLSRDWYNLGQLAEITGRDREWIERRLAGAGINSERRRSALTGKSSKFYPPTALKYLESLSRQSPAGDWLTSLAIAEKLGRAQKWVDRRLKVLQLLNYGQLRLDDLMVPRVHYPPLVFRKLQSESEHVSSHSESNGWLTFSGLTNELGRSRLWVANRLPEFEEVMELRRDGKGRLTPHYPPKVLAALQEYNAEYYPAGSWLTVKELSERIDAPRQAVEKLLWMIEPNKERRLTKRANRPEWHYPPVCEAILRNEIQKFGIDPLVAADQVLPLLKDLISYFGNGALKLRLGMSSNPRRLLSQSRLRTSIAEQIRKLHEETFPSEP